MNTLSAWLLGSAIALILAGNGRGVLMLLRTRVSHPEADFAVSLGIGAGIYSYLFFALGHAGVISAGVYWAVFGAGLALAIPGLRVLLHGFQAVSFELPAQQPRWLYRWMFAVLVVCILLTFISAAAPVSDWDSRQYHLEAPRRYIRDGIAQFYADDVTLNLYLGQSMLNLWILTIGRDSACQVLSWWFGIGLLCSTHALARRLYSPAAALTATVLVAAFAFFSERSIQPTPDIAAAMMSILVVYLLVEMRERAGPTEMAVMGMLAGVAVAFRMNSALSLIFIAVFSLIWWRWFCSMHWHRIFLLATVAVIFCLAFWLPWSLRNYVWTGNPVYPFMYETFGGWMWNDRSEQFASYLWVPTDGEFWERVGVGMQRLLSSIRFGTLTAALAALALIFREKRRESSLMLVTVLVGIIVLGRFSRIDRYFVTVMLLAAIPAGHALVMMLAWRGSFARALAALVAVILLADLGASGVWHQSFVRATLGFLPRDEFLRNCSGFYDDFVWMNQNLPPDAEVLVIFSESYYLERPAVRFWGGMAPQIGLFDFGRYAGVEDFAGALQDAGVTHLFFADPDDPIMRPMYWDPGAFSEEGIRLVKALADEHSVLVRHNPESAYNGRMLKFGAVGTYLYRLTPIESATSG